MERIDRMYGGIPWPEQWFRLAPRETYPNAKIDVYMSQLLYKGCLLHRNTLIDRAMANAIGLISIPRQRSGSSFEVTRFEQETVDPLRLIANVWDEVHGIILAGPVARPNMVEDVLIARIEAMKEHALELMKLRTPGEQLAYARDHDMDPTVFVSSELLAKTAWRITTCRRLS